MRFLTSEALLFLLAFDLFGFGRDFSRMHRFVRSRKVGPKAPGADAVECVCNAVNIACIWYPKRVLCLQRSVVTTCLLRRYGIPAQMVMGAQKVPFRAHAWTEVEGQAINERNDVKKRYGVWERC
jgi:hypothetical protein